MLKTNRVLNIFLAATAAACSTSALAYIFDDEDEPSYHIGIQGNYLWQSNNTAESNSDGFQTVDAFTPVPRSVFPLVNSEFSGQWGGEVDLAYIFSSRKYDLSASYTFLRSDQAANDSVVVFNSGAPPFRTHASYDLDFDSGDILFGQYFQPGKRWLLHVGYGLGVVRIDQESNSKYKNSLPISGFQPPDVTTTHNTVYSSNSFVGLGPKVTFDADFRLIRDIYVVGGVGLSALYGETETKFSSDGVVTYNKDGSIFRTLSFPVEYEEENHQGTLGFEGNIGLAYAAEISEDLIASLEIGFTAETYINALEDGEFDFHTNPTDGSNSPSVEFDGTYSNFGPYINLSVDFM